MKSPWFRLLILVCSYLPLLSAQTASSTDPAVEARITRMLSRLTLEQKIDLLGGVDGFYAPGVPELGLPKMKMSDGPMGTRNDGPATAMAGGIGLAATWNDQIAREVGLQIGRDARARGVHFMLGPGVNIYKSPRNGRNFEYFGEDPWLASRMAVAYIEGMQSQNVSATVKHFMGNNSEFDRHNVDSIIDERTMRELYMPAFEAAVKEAHVGAVMDSYNLTNGSHMTQNGYLNTEVVKKEWGFDGIVMSDWLSTYDGVASANGGLDLEMPSGAFMNRKTLLPAVQSGKLSEAIIDDKVRRILRTAIRFGWLDHNQTSLEIPLDNQDGSRAALRASEEGIVLLKNDRGLLPLPKEIKSIAVIGPDAYPAVPVAGGSAQVAAFSSIGFMEGLSKALAPNAKVFFNRGVAAWSKLANQTRFSTPDGKPGLLVEHFDNPNLAGTPTATHTELHVNHKPQFTIADLADLDLGELFANLGGTPSAPPTGSSDRFSGTYTAPTAGTYEVFVQAPGESGGHRLLIDDKPVLDDWQIRKAMVDSTTVELSAGLHKIVYEQFLPGAPDFFGGSLRLGIAPQNAVVDPAAKALAAQADAVVVCVGFDPDSESEAGDRTFNLPFGQEQLIKELAAANRNVVVVATSGGAVETAGWLDRVPAFLEAWYPGQNGGTALAKIVLGEVNPSGRLPISYDNSWDDNPSHESYYPQPGTNRVEYKDGLFVGYRGYEHLGKTPAFPFGYGLSYTTYKYGNLTIRADDKQAGSYTVSFDVTNTGNRAGKEVAQVYVGEPHAQVTRPAKELKGFAKVELQPGETKTVAIPLNARAFSYYDTANKRWQADAAQFEISVGSSSADIALRDKITLKTALTSSEFS